MIFKLGNIHRQSFAISIFLVLQLLVACKSMGVTPQSVFTQTQTNPYTTIIKPLSCSLPCWQGIEVNKTSFKDAREILIQKYGIENIETFRENSISWEVSSGNIHQGNISFYNGLTSQILVTFDKDGNFTVANIIEILDNPAWIFVGSQPHYQCMGLRMEYPSMGVSVYLDIADEIKIIESASPIFMLTFNQAIQSEHMQVNDGYLVKWDGYKEYCKEQ